MHRAYLAPDRDVTSFFEHGNETSCFIKCQ
jgi:hypothetical protein